jgi:hypothetical protein
MFLRPSCVFHKVLCTKKNLRKLAADSRRTRALLAADSRVPATRGPLAADTNGRIFSVRSVDIYNQCHTSFVKHSSLRATTAQRVPGRLVCHLLCSHTARHALLCMQICASEQHVSTGILRTSGMPCMVAWTCCSGVRACQVAATIEWWHAP